MFNLCAPTIIYIIFSITQILIDTFKGLYNTAFIKTIVMIMISFLLNILCQSGLGIISWIIVFIPFIFMTVIVAFLLYIFGLNASTGSFNYKNNKMEDKMLFCSKNIKIDQSGNIIVYNPNYDELNNPVKYKKPNLIIPNPNSRKIDDIDINKFKWTSSDPAYQS